MHHNSILCVIVLYNKNLNDSVSYNSLLKHSVNFSIELKKIIYNNSNNIKIPFSENYLVYNSEKNTMLSGAYNYALKKADEYGVKWLLLLDQDSLLNPDYFSELEKALALTSLENTAAIVPILENNGKLLSPILNCSEQNVWWFQKQICKPGYYNGYITAFNSGALFNVNFFNSIGGFSNKYPLDRLDYWCFLQLYKNRKKTYVLDAVLEHDLSILDYDKNMNLARYKSILNAETAFAKETGIFSLTLYKLLIFVRCIKQLFFTKNKKYAYHTFVQFWK